MREGARVEVRVADDGDVPTDTAAIAAEEEQDLVAAPSQEEPDVMKTVDNEGECVRLCECFEEVFTGCVMRCAQVGAGSQSTPSPCPLLTSAARRVTASSIPPTRGLTSTPDT